MAYYYQIYGLTLACDFALKAPLPSTSRVADVTISLGSVANQPGPSLEPVAAYAAVNATSFWLNQPAVARFYCPDLNSIIVDPIAPADFDSIELFLLGSVLGPLLNLRKQLVMHANVLQIGLAERLVNVLICGDSATGKSTLSGHLLRHHQARLVADDVAVINGRGQVELGSPVLKLWQDTATVLGLDVEQLQPIRAQVHKYDWPLPAHFAEQPCSVDLVIILGNDNSTGVELTELDGSSKLMPLQNNIFRRFFATKAGLERLHFMLIAQAFGKCPVIRLTRPAGGNIADNLEQMTAALANFVTDHELGGARK